MLRFRKLEPWMQQGNLVALPGGAGTIESMVTAKLGASTGTPTDEPVMLSCTIRPYGTKYKFPCNPWNISQLKTPKLPIN